MSEHKTTVERKTWAHDDEYLVIEVQVPEREFEAGDTVKVIVTKEHQKERSK